MIDFADPVFILSTVAVVSLLWYVTSRQSSRTRECSPYRMDPVSSSILLSEVDPTGFAQVHIVSLIVFESTLAYTDFRERFVENQIRSDPHSRLLHVLEPGYMFKPSCWKKAENWHPYDNFSVVESPQTPQSVQDLVSRRLTESLDMKKPLWAVQFIEQYSDGTSSTPVSAALITLHHAMGDGFTLCHQIMRRSSPSCVSKSMQECYPFQAPAGGEKISTLEKCRIFLKFFTAAKKLVLMKPDPVGALRNVTPRSLTDRIVSDRSVLSFSVEDLKILAKKCTQALEKKNPKNHSKVYLNDVVVAAVTTVLGDLMGHNRHDVTSAIWVGLDRKSPLERPKNPRFDWGNEKLGTCYLCLPTGERTPFQILEKCHRRLSAMKSSPEPIVANRLLKLIGSIPLWIVWPFRFLLMDKMSTSISNFPGPVHPIKYPVSTDGGLSGSTNGVGVIKDTFFWVAPPFSYGPYVTIMSYCGKMYFGMCAAEKLIDQETLTKIVHAKVDLALSELQSEIDHMLIA